MDAQAHIVELQRKHRNLDELIEEELSHPASDELRVGELKRKKLKLKEEIERLKVSTH